MEFYFNGRYAGTEVTAGDGLRAAGGGFFAADEAGGAETAEAAGGGDAKGGIHVKTAGARSEAGSGVGAVTYPVTVRARKKSNGAKVLIKIWPKDAPEGRIECELWKNAYKGVYLESRTEGGRLVMARKWIDGETLDVFAERNGPCAREKAAEIVLAVARKLKDFYEATGMYHGDLKPENIVYDGEDVFLIDFESAGPEPRGGNAPKTGSAKTVRLVSEGFSAPEISRGMPCCRSDFYSLGMILTFLITGKTGPEAVSEIGGAVGQFAGVCTDSAVGRRFGGIEELANELRSAVQEETLNETDPRENDAHESGAVPAEGAAFKTDNGSQDGIPERIPGGTVSVENMNVTAARITFSIGGESLPVNGGDVNGESPETVDEPGGEPVHETQPEAQAGNPFITQPESSPETKPDKHPEKPVDASPAQSEILFPHMEKGYRKLILYVPGNVAFAAELGYVTSAYMGFRTCVYELCDCTNPRVGYYLEAGSGEKTVDAGFDAGITTGVSGAPAEGRRDAERVFYETAVSEPGAVYSVAGLEKRNAVREEREEPFFETERCEFGRSLFFGSGKKEPGTVPDDSEMRDFMSWAYSEFDVTVVCDSTRESSERRNGFLRFCDYVLVPVEMDADSVEAEISHFTWLMRSNGISLKRLKLAGWEKVCDEGAEDAFPGEACENSFLGFIGYDRRRHYTKNAEGGYYCRTMPREIVSEYCRIAGALAYGDRSCA